MNCFAGNRTARSMRGRRSALVFCALYALCNPQIVLAQVAQVSPAAAPSPSPTPIDPCSGPARLLATANRPTVGYSTCAIAQHTAVFELGYQNQIIGTASSGATQSQVPQNFLRIGVVPRFEIDVIGPNYVSTRTYGAGRSDRLTNGITDSGFGVKYEFVPSGKWMAAIDALDTPPTGSPFLTAGNATLTGNLDVNYAMSSATSIGTTIAVSATGGFTAAGIHERYGVTEPSVVLTTQIPHFYQFYAEYVYASKIAPDQAGRAFVDGGIQKLLGARTEIDIEYGHSLIADPALSFHYIGAGMVIQLW